MAIIASMRNRDLKLAALLFLVICASALILCACTVQPNQDAADISAECIRIHIRANSNSIGDQQVKLAVRDAITEYLSIKLENCKTKQAALARLNSEQQNLVQIANQTLYENNFTYKASIAIKKEHFPQRVYEGYIFPEDDYDALILNLGTGEGDNWWCVAFPPLCFVPDGGSGEKIVYKSWIKEKLTELFA